MLVFSLQIYATVYGLVASMSGKGDCWDNIPMESFWGILKNELVHHQKFKIRSPAEFKQRYYANLFAA